GSCALPLEPGLDREGGRAEARGRTEGHVVVRSIEVKCTAGGCGCRCRCRRGSCCRCGRTRCWGDEARDPDRPVCCGAVDAAAGRISNRSPGALVHAQRPMSPDADATSMSFVAPISA